MTFDFSTVQRLNIGRHMGRNTPTTRTQLVQWISAGIEVVKARASLKEAERIRNDPHQLDLEFLE